MFRGREKSGNVRLEIAIKDPASVFRLHVLMDGMREASQALLELLWGKKYHRDSKREMPAQGFKQVDYK